MKWRRRNPCLFSDQHEHKPSVRAPALAGGSYSGFRPAEAVAGAAGLPVGLHLKETMVMEMRLPQFDMLDSDADILKWHKKEGDQITEGEPLVEIETGKAVGGLEAPATGVLVRIVAQVGATVTSGEVLAVIEEAE